MDAVFSNGNQSRLNYTDYTVITPNVSDVIVDIVNDDDEYMAMNKRKLSNTSDLDEKQRSEDEDPKRLCTANDYHEPHS